MSQNLDQHIGEENENANVEFGPITIMVLQILPIFLQILPYNIEWMHYVYNLARNIGDQPQINSFLTEEQWNQYKRDMDIIIQGLPPRMPLN
jgi:hypothetical protein